MNGIIRKSGKGRILSEAGRVVLILRRESPDRYTVSDGAEKPLYTLTAEKDRFRIRMPDGQVFSACVRPEGYRYAPLPETARTVTVPLGEAPVLIRREGDSWLLERDGKTLGSCRGRLFDHVMDLRDDGLTDGGLIPGILMALTDRSAPDIV